MYLDFNHEKPIYIQIAEQIEEAIFTGAFEEETQIPSTTEISTTFKINPATILKGMNLLVDSEIIYKKRGIGMFVSTGAYIKIKDKRQEQFINDVLKNFMNEAKKLGIEKDDIIQLIERSYNK